VAVADKQALVNKPEEVAVVVYKPELAVNKQGLVHKPEPEAVPA
jgi:hypothetical protein